MNTMKIAVKIAFMAAATIPAAASAQEAGRMLSLDEAVAVTAHPINQGENSLIL